MSYTVRSGDTLSSIASRHGVSLAALEKANPQIHNPNSIYVGEHINLPGSKDTFHAAKKKAAPKKKAPNPVTTLKSDLSKMNKAVSAEHKAQHTYNVHVAAEKSALQKIEHQKETLETEWLEAAAILE